MDELFQWAEEHPCTAAETPVQVACACPPVEEPAPAELLAVLAVLERHRGAAEAITAPRIAEAAGLWLDMAPANRGTKIRKLLELHQERMPWPLCGDVDGYYIAGSAEELTHYCANLASRARCILRRYASFRNVARKNGWEFLGKGRWREKGDGMK